MLKIYFDNLAEIKVSEKDIRFIRLDGITKSVTWIKDIGKLYKNESLDINELLIILSKDFLKRKDSGTPYTNLELIKEVDIAFLEIDGKEYCPSYDYDEEDNSNKNEEVYILDNGDIAIIVGNSDFRNKMIEECKTNDN